MPMKERIVIEETNAGEGPRYDLWGQLVKKWARNAVKRPETVDELIEQCKAEGVTIKIPKRYYGNKIQYAEANENTLLFRLPPPTLTADAEVWLPQGGDYPLPAFYKRIFQDVDPIIPDKKKLHDERVGDYSMGNCA
jgi:hypothetical protein